MHPWLHFKTITKHKLLVMHYCFRAGMYKQGLLHDLSKYAPVEFLVGCKYYQGDRSPNNAEREDTGISKSWLHHKGRNKHHFEYWVDYAPGDEHIINGVPMPRKYIAEMVMDRISASRNYLGDKYDQHQPLDYYLKGKEKLWFIHPKTKRDLEGLLRILNDHGEEVLISYIKNVYLKKETVTGVQLADGAVREVSGVFVALGVAGSTALARKLGAAVEGSRIVVDDKMQTTVPEIGRAHV